MPAQYAAVIPCYNVGKAILPVASATAAQVDVCVIVDDGSSDDTETHLKNLDLRNVSILSHDKNQGKGTALVTGFSWILEKKPEVNAVFTLDGDGQHDPSYIGKFKTLFDDAKPDLIYGNRMNNLSGMPKARQLLNRFSNWTMTRICGRPIFDSQCGFRLHSKSLLAEVLPTLTTNRYVLETEILVKACRRGFKIATIPISTIYSPESNVLSHHNLHDVVRIARFMVSYFFRSRES
jgi:glycosyltransferase involved in cell wall biosynthesis